MAQKSTLSGRTLKFDETLRPVMGRAIVYKENGEPALDQQCDHIREDARHGAARDLMQNSQLAGDMRPRDGDGQPIEAGTVIFAWRLTDGASEPFNIEFNSTGLIISMHPDAYMLERYRGGGSCLAIGLPFAAATGAVADR